MGVSLNRWSNTSVRIVFRDEEKKKPTTSMPLLLGGNVVG
jgi:hypothetical protein